MHELEKDTRYDRVYYPLLQSLLRGKCVNPANSNVDRQEAARFCLWLRNDLLIPVITVRYSDGTIGYAIAKSEIDNYFNHREAQKNKMKQLNLQRKRERGAIATLNFYQSVDKEAPDFVMNYVQSAKKNKGENSAIMKSNEDPATGKW